MLEQSRRNLLKSAAGALAIGLTGTLDGRSAEVPLELRRLKITACKTYVLKHQLAKPFGVSVSVPLSKTRTALMVKLETDAGLVGWGETGPISGARGTIDDQLAPKLIGQNPLEYRKLWRELWGPNFGNGLAVGAVEMALNDLRGKALKLPVAELFGGRLREQVPLYGGIMNYVEGEQPEETFPREALNIVRQGYRAMKMRIGRFGFKRDANIARIVREAVGPDIQLMADGNGAYTERTALQMGDALQELNFEFFEEPLPQSPRYAGYEELREKLNIPLAGGEVLDGRATAHDLINRRAFDIIQPDAALCGGIGEAVFIAELAALSRIRCIPHCWGGAISIAAATHLAALLPEPHWGYTPDTPLLEYDLTENPWRTEIVREPLKVEKGRITVPVKPGLGIDVLEDVIQRYAV